MTRRAENLLPYWAAGIIGIVAGLLAYYGYVSPLPDIVFLAMVPFGGVIAGFTLTHRSKLLSMGNAKIITFLANTGHSEGVLKYMMHNAIVSIAVSVFSLSYFLIDDGAATTNWIWALWLAVWVYLIALMILMFVRNEVMMFHITKRFMEGKRNNNGPPPLGNKA